MGLALIMEGILSGCYHVCPSHNNFQVNSFANNVCLCCLHFCFLFQFDTAFMYTIALLILLKIYQTRHPDINANAYSAFGALAFIIFIGSIGVLHATWYFWVRILNLDFIFKTTILHFSQVFFAGLHVISCLFLSSQIYFMGRCRMDRGLPRRAFLHVKTSMTSLCSGNIRALKPMYPDR